ncbi:MAG: hypothetical protein FWB78_09715 [Treponema sp.]|nr:hypothetical protein [Treponema sp.]
MQRSGKVFVVAIALFFIVGGSLIASPNLISSPQRQATAGQLWSDADRFIDPRDWADMEFDRWFGLVSFDTVRMARLGFATSFNGLYLALSYSGNAWNIPGHIFNEQQIGAGFFAAPRNGRFYTITPWFPAGGSVPDNSVSVLIGVADMGFRLSYSSTHWSRRIDDLFTFGGQFYRSSREEIGSINPELAWGMARELVPGRGIRPHVYIDLDFARDNHRVEQYTAVTLEVVDRVNRSNNSLTLNFTAAMGGFSILRQNGFDLGVDLWYTLSLPMYNNYFNYIDAAGNQRVGSGYRGRFSATGPNANEFTEIRQHLHAVTPYLYAFWEGEGITLAAELGLGMGFGGRRTTEMALRTGTSTLVNNGWERAESFFSLEPTLGLGMQWAVVPERFFLNAGGIVQFGGVSFESAENTEYNDGARVEGSGFRSVNRMFYDANTALSVGVTFQITPNVGVQANSGVEAGNVANFFGSLTSFSEILATIRF